MSQLSASLNMNSSLGPGKVRAMFQARRNGGSSAQGSPVGWDKSYPLEPIQRGTPPHKATPPHRASQQQKRVPPTKSGARFSPPQATVSGGGRQPPARAGNTLRKAKSHNNLVAEEPAKRAGKLSRSNSLSGRAGRRKPPRRADDRSRVNDEMRRRDGELLTKIKGNGREPAALQAGARRRSKAPAKARSPAPPVSRGGNASRSDGRSPTPARVAGSRRPSFTPYKENKPAVAPSPRPPPTDPKMAQCPICTRSFAKDRLDKHQAICEKTSQKKRKTFDPVKMRVQGTGSEQYIKKIKSNKPDKTPGKKDWRKQHEEFVQNIREAKKAQSHIAAGGDIRDLPPPPPQDTSDYVQCPHCDRRFNETAAERHIPKCSSIESNKGPARRGRDGGGGRKRR